MRADRERTRGRRAALAAALDPERSPVPRPRRSALQQLELSPRRAARRRRALHARLFGAALLLLMVPAVIWAYYRFGHVVSRNAQVKGYITQVGAQLDGVVTSIEVEAGQRVKAGDLLARFEDHQLRANVQRAKSRVEKASRELEVERLAIEQERRRLGGVAEEASARTDAARAQSTAAQTQAEDAAIKYNQRKTLADRGLIAAEELRAAETTRRTAEALAANARADESAAQAAERLAGLDSEGLSVRSRRLEVLESEVSTAGAELALAEADLAAAQVRAPADGWVVRRIAEAGASVVVGQPVLALWIGKDVWVEAWVDEDELAHIAPGNPVRVTVKAFPRRVYRGRVESVGVSTDFEVPAASVPQPRESRMRTTPVVCVRVRLDESDGLFPGLSAVAGIQKKSP